MDNGGIMSPPTQLARTILGALLLALLGVTAALSLALRQPWLGLDLTPTTDADMSHGGIVVRATAADGPAAMVAPGSTLLSLRASGAAARPVRLGPSDLIEDPDFFDSYAAMDGFFRRQDRLAAIQRGTVQVEWRDPSGRTLRQQLQPLPERPLASLPAAFWFQLACGIIALLAGAWVFALKPRSRSAQLFAVAGLFFLPTTLAAAVYSSRELALPGALFGVLSVVNHFGALGFGGALAALFLVYPARLAPQPLLWLLAATVLGWWFADALRFAPDVTWGIRAPMLAELLLAVALAVLQWQRSAARAADRAALRWFILSALVGSALFMILTLGSTLMGFFPPLQQGYAFGLFLLMYVGLGLGVGRYHLFDLDRWAYRVLLWALGLAVVVALDLMLLVLLHGRHTLALALTLMIAALLFVPLRRWFWRRMMHAQLPPIERLLPEIIAVAFTAVGAERERRWVGLLDRLYQPQRNVPLDRFDGAPDAGLADDGSELRIAAAGGVAARCLQGRSAGQRLFSPIDAALAASLVALLDQAAAGRDALEAGVQRERDRIASDLHDDIGAKLLTLRHCIQGEREQAMLMTTIDQLRAIVRGLRQPAQPWDDFVADLRAETSQRLAAAGVGLDWPAPLIAGPAGGFGVIPEDAARQYHLRALLQEAVSNAIRHARARCVRVRLTLQQDGALMRLEVIDDGIGIPPERAAAGHGLTSMQIRARALGGRIDWRPAGPAATDAAPTCAESGDSGDASAPGPGTRVELTFPLQAGAA